MGSQLNRPDPTANEMMTRIRGLKQRIGRARRQAEQIFADVPVNVPETISRLRDQLENEQRAYERLIGDYPMSQAEKRAAAFNARLADLITVEFSVGGFFDGHRIGTVDFRTNRLTFECLPEEWFASTRKVRDRNFRPSVMLRKLRALHLEEWRRQYVENDMVDGTQWGLELRYTTGRLVKFYGSNDYPYNYDELTKLFGIS